MVDGNGHVIGSATTADGNPGIATVYLAGTDTLADIYESSVSTGVVHYVSTDEHGYFYFWVDDSDYAATQEFKIISSHPDFRAQTYDYIRIIPSSGSGTGGISNIVEDLTPQLGGDLDMNGHKIGGNSETDIDNAVANYHTAPSDTAYGASWNGVTTIAPSKNAVYDKIESIEAGAGISNIVEDTTPQLGGNLDMNGYTIGGSTEAQLDDAVSKKHTQGTDTTLGVMTANVDMGGHWIANVGTCTEDDEAANKAYVDAHAGISTHGLVSAYHTVSSLTPGHVLTALTATTFGFTAIAGGGDVLGPATNNDEYVPQWDGADSKLLKDGFSITAAGKALIDDADASAMRTTLGLGTSAVLDADLTNFTEQTAWRVFYSDADGDVTELALGTDGQYLKSNGAAVAPTWGTPSGAGDVSGPASSTDMAIVLWDGTGGDTLQDSLITVDAAGAPTFPNDTAIRWLDSSGNPQNVIAYDSVDNIIIGVDGDDATVYIERLDTSTALAPLQDSRRFSIVANYWKSASQHQRMFTIYHEMQSDTPKSTVHFDMGEDGAEIEAFALENDGGTILNIVKGSIKIEGGSPGVGKVLTSDVNGLATWETPSSGSLDNVVEDLTPQLGGDLDTNDQDITGIGSITIADGDRLYIGTSSDMLIRNDGTYNRIDLQASDDFILYDLANSKECMRAYRNGAVTLDYNGVTKFATTDTGATITGYTTFEGTYGDMIIGEQTIDASSFSAIQINGTNNFVIYDASGSKSMIGAYQDSYVVLYYNGSRKFETSNTGITVTGACSGCDYVFEPGYDLMSLDELSTYVKKHECLPNMSVNQGKKVEFNSLRQESIEKIEELTLYTLQLHERVKALEAIL